MKSIGCRSLLRVAAFSLFLSAIAPCAVAADVTIDGPKDLVGRKCAVVVGSMMGDMTLKVQPGIGIEWFNDYNSGIEAVRLGKIDAMPLDLFFARRWAKNDSASFAITQPYHSIPWGYLFARGSVLRDRAERVLEKMRTSGELDRILKKWCEADDPTGLELDKLDYRSDFTGKAGTLRFATPGDREPVSFVRPDGIVGFDIDIVRRIAYELDMQLKIVQISMGALVPAVQGGKADMGGGGIAITEERAKQVDFSSCYYRVPTVFLIRRSSVADSWRTLADLQGKKCACILGTATQDLVEKLQKGLVFCSFNDAFSCIEALRLGKVDAWPIDTAMAERWVANCPDEFCLAFRFSENPNGFLFPKGSPLREKVDEVLKRMIASGEVGRIINKWCGTPDLATVDFEPLRSQAKPTGKLRMVGSPDWEPAMFMRNNEPVGFDIDILRLVADELGLELAIQVVNPGAVVPAVQNGRADVAAGSITITAARKEKADFSVCYYDAGFSVVRRKNSVAAKANESESSALLGWCRSLRESVVRTFVTEDRWLMMARGLGLTVLITFLSVLLGSLLAFPVWAARTAANGVVSALAKGYISVMQGTPVLVLLMVLFYLVFGKVDIDGIWVAVIGFSLNASAYFGEMLRSGIDSVPRGQTEAALALGYRPRRAFCRFILPQAVRTILPVYRGEVIGLLKSTSIVGYIAINDLTKASDLIRSRTYESFFPILTTAFVYFVAAWLIALLFDWIGRRLDPASRR